MESSSSSTDGGEPHPDRVITVRALAEAQACLRDAYAGYDFLANLGDEQRGWYKQEHR